MFESFAGLMQKYAPLYYEVQVMSIYKSVGPFIQITDMVVISRSN